LEGTPDVENRANYFPTDTQDLREARGEESLQLADGDRVELRISPIAKRIGPNSLRMLGYDASVPGPSLRVQQGSTLLVDVINDGDLHTTVHWHGLRLDNRYDGTTETQPAIAIDNSFRYRLEFPDPGIYWYHPHIRQDYGQELGLYGNIVVQPSDPEYWPAAHRELTLMLDDILIEDGKIAPFDRSVTNYTAMGRFGNILLVNGDPALALTALEGEVVRLYLTNTANTRVFKVALPGARMKLVGGDSGHYEREAFVESVIIAPSERAIVDVLFREAGQLTLEHRTPNRTYPLASITVTEEQAQPSLREQFELLRVNTDMVSERDRIRRYLSAEPDKTLALVAEMELGPSELPGDATIEYFCPMHPDVVSHEPGKCPLCAMKLIARAESAPAHAHSHAAGGHSSNTTGGIEWEDDMVEVNRTTNPENTRWKLIDRATGAEGHAIDWRFRIGDQVKIRLVNDMESDHPMHHPFHIHGAGRFLILSRDGVAEDNLVWKDTVLIPTGQTVDILLDVTHAGRWMAHCHIAEHHEGGMMLTFEVE
jgi:FtsP/CotA-like multicopper oxidase with cupredoxin domain